MLSHVSCNDVADQDPYPDLYGSTSLWEAESDPHYVDKEPNPDPHHVLKEPDPDPRHFHKSAGFGSASM